MRTFSEFRRSLNPLGAQSQRPFEDGRWLSAKGPYCDYIAAYCKLNPNLKTADSKNRWSASKEVQARVTMLELEQGSRTCRVEFKTAADLAAHLKHSSRAIGSQNCRIFIMEGLSPAFVAVLGDHFLMDPTFFMGQERTSRWGLSFEGSKNTPELPSLLDSSRIIALKYYEPRDFGEIKTFSMWCARTSRNISVTRNTRPDLHNLRYEPIGIVHRKCSLWFQRIDRKGWDVVILCDPPVERIFIQEEKPNMDASIRSKYSRWMPQPPKEEEAPNNPFSGGYRDFIKHPEFGRRVPKGPPRTSMLEDLCFYWTEHGDKLEGMSGPASVALFMYKIVASHYMQLIEFARANVANLEFQLSRRDSLKDIHVPWIEAQWSDLQAWSWRCTEYAEQVEAIMMSLGAAFPTQAGQERQSDWRSCEKDFQHIHHRLSSLKIRVEMFMNSVTGLAGIAGNRHALREARRSLHETLRIKAITLLGMVFLPLAFCTGLFSMNEQYLPGSSSFWVYLCVALPLILAVFLVTFLLGLGYNEEGEWKVDAISVNVKKQWNRPKRHFARHLND